MSDYATWIGCEQGDYVRARDVVAVRVQSWPDGKYRTIVRDVTGHETIAFSGDYQDAFAERTRIVDAITDSSRVRSPDRVPS